MAYGNWGAFVYKNGNRETSREDNTPYKEDEMESGYWQAFGMRDEDSLPCCHATLGVGDFRLCGYKCYPIIYFKGERIDMKPYQIGNDAGTDNWDITDPGSELKGELEGNMFEAYYAEEPSRVFLRLVDSQGNKWDSECGYMIGAGFEEENEKG